MEPVSQMNKFLLFIIGTTAAGKTKLSLSLGQKFQGEIISCDSMQIYKKVDIMTAKATAQEQQLVKHYLIDRLDLKEKQFNRNRFHYLAQECMGQIQQAHKFPILVGGTHYYMESILFNQKIDPPEEESSTPPKPSQDATVHKKLKAGEELKPEEEKCSEACKQQKDSGSDAASDWGKEPASPQLGQQKLDSVAAEIQKMSKQEQYDRLKQLDPLIANKIHPNDQRKVQTYLLKAMTSEKPPSLSYENYDTVPLRNENCLIFWPRCTNVDNLKNQQRKRISEMVYSKGVDEIISVFSELVGDKYDDPDCLQGGVMQSIGYKEFLPLYKFYRQEIKTQPPGHIQPADMMEFLKKTESGLNILNQCIDRLVISTYQYTKRQLRWIKYKIMMNQSGAQIKNRLYVFDFTEFTGEHFKQRVIDPATQILQRYFDLSAGDKTLSGSQIIDLLAQDKELAQYLIKEEELQKAKSKHLNKDLSQWKNFTCDVCHKYIFGQKEYKQHMKSKGHKKQLKYLAKMKEKARKQGESNQPTTSQMDSGCAKQLPQQQEQPHSDPQETKVPPDTDR